MVSTAVATYLPESMQIRIGPDLRVLNENGELFPIPSATALASFFHEYVHYIHNVSTASGIAAFVNTLELWRCFRLTIDETGDSVGSVNFHPVRNKHLQDLTAYLDSARRKNVPPIKTLINAEYVKVLSLRCSNDIATAQGTLLSVVECDAEVVDRGGQSEKLTVRIGTLELLEGAAWLLEKKLAAALDPQERIVPPPVFPYQVAQAAAEYAVSGIDDEGVLACILAALQSSDAPGAFADLLSLAQKDKMQPNGAACYFCRKAAYGIAQKNADLETQLAALEREFANDGVMAKAVRHIIGEARKGFAERARKPFFELDMISALQTGAKTLDQTLRELLPCAVLQRNPGPDDQLQRDFLLYFRSSTNADSDDIESFLRVVHCIFDYVRAHRCTTGFVGTAQARKHPCPFYSCCDLALRQEEPSICAQSPWQAADWPAWNKEKHTCWYGNAVRITRSPPD